MANKPLYEKAFQQTRIQSSDRPRAMSRNRVRRVMRHGWFGAKGAC
jgi:hypothetical protein